MNKLRDQFAINDRLREYVERMLTVIIENNPQLLEVTTTSGVSIGSMGMSSLPSTKPSPQQPTTTSTPAGNKFAIPRFLASTESVKIDPSLPATTHKEPADKYCRL
jgi:hypothetical protein